MSNSISPHQRAARRALLAIGLGTAFSLMGDAALYAVLPTHTADAGITLVSVGVILSANRWIRLLLNGPAGLAYDRWPRRRFFVPALFLGALSTALYAATTGFWPLLAGRLLWGLAWSGIWVGGNTIILDVTTLENRGRWTGLYQLSFYLGGTLGFQSGGLLTDWLGYHNGLFVAAGVTLLGAVFALLFLPETRQFGEHLAAPEAEPGEATPAIPAPAARPGLRPVTALYSLNRFVAAGVLSSTLGLVIQQHWGALRLNGSLIGVATLTGTMLGLSTLISMITAPIAGHWSDRDSNRWRIAARGLIPGVLGLGLLALGAPWMILLGVPLSAVASGSSQSLATTLLGDRTAGQKRGRALGWMHTFGDLASAIAPPLAYGLLPLVGLSGVYLLCAVLLAAMAVWAQLLARRHPSALPEPR